MKIKKSKGLIEKIIVVIILLYSSGVWWHVQWHEQINNPDLEPYGAGLITIMNLGIYLFCFASIVKYRRRFFYVLTRDKLILALVTLALLSCFWSYDPESTIDNCKGLLRITLLAAYMATRFELKEQMKLYLWVFSISGVLSLIVGIAMPEQGIMADWLGDGELGWRGVFFHKNMFGRMMVLSSGSFLLLALSKPRYSWLAWGFASLSVASLWLSNSKGSLVSFVIIFSIFPIWKMLKQSYKLKMFLINFSSIATIGGALLFSIYYVLILTSLGKDPSLTGRIPMWTLLIDKIKREPLLGYGYNGFWSSKEGLEVTKLYAWAEQAHNGFLEITLSLGLVGLIILILHLLRNTVMAINWMRAVNQASELWAVQVLLVLFCSNCFMVSTFLSLDAMWLLYATISFSLALQSDRSKRDKSYLAAYHKPRMPRPVKRRVLSTSRMRK